VYNAAYEKSFAGNDRDQVNWLKILIYLNILLIMCFFAGAVVIIGLDLKIPTTPVEWVVALALLYVVLFYVIKKPAIFSLPAAVLVEPEKASVTKYQKQKLSETERKVYLEKIEKYIREEKPFLDDKVTAASLARELAIPAHHFSMVINIERNMNFYHFINFYRVEEAKSLLQDSSLAHETVLDIGLMAGFQSKAGFNKIFKEITGKTPSEFRSR
jgi:AraC-like DNA-binding protein